MRDTSLEAHCFVSQVLHTLVWCPAKLSLKCYFSIAFTTCKPVQALPRWLSSKESACSAGDTGLILELGRASGEGSGYSLQYSCLGNPMHRGAWQTTVHGVVELDMT